MTNKSLEYFTEEESRELLRTKGPCLRDGGKVKITKRAGYLGQPTGQPTGIIDLHCETCGARGEING